MKHQEVAQRLALAIEHDGRQKREIASAAGMKSRQILTNMLGGRGGRSHIQALANVLHVDPRWLTHGENPPTWAAPAEASMARTLERLPQEIAAWRRANAKGEAGDLLPAHPVTTMVEAVSEADGGLLSLRLELPLLVAVYRALDRARSKPENDVMALLTAHAQSCVVMAIATDRKLSFHDAAASLDRQTTDLLKKQGKKAAKS